MDFRPYKGVGAMLLAALIFIGINPYFAQAQELRWKTIMGIKESGDVVGMAPEPSLAGRHGRLSAARPMLI